MSRSAAVASPGNYGGKTLRISAYRRGARIAWYRLCAAGQADFFPTERGGEFARFPVGRAQSYATGAGNGP